MERQYTLGGLSGWQQPATKRGLDLLFLERTRVQMHTRRGAGERSAQGCRANKRLVLYEYNGSEVLAHLQACDPGRILQTDDVVLILPRYNSHDATLETAALRYGVCGFLYRAGSIAKLKEMVETISKGELWVPTEVLSTIVKRSLSRKAPTAKYGLSERELEILKLLALGKRNAAIATSCRLSPHTVKTHLHRI